MSLFCGLTLAALFAGMPVGGAPRAAAKPPQVQPQEEPPPRVEIGPAILTIYDDKGNVISVE